jgi:hypothetical protein
MILAPPFGKEGLDAQDDVQEVTNVADVARKDSGL